MIREEMLEMIRKEEELLWHVLQDLNECNCSKLHIDCARARWYEARKIRIMLNGGEVNND